MELKFPFLAMCINIITHLLSDNCCRCVYLLKLSECLAKPQRTFYMFLQNFNMFCLKKYRKSAADARNTLQVSVPFTAPAYDSSMLGLYFTLCSH